MTSIFQVIFDRFRLFSTLNRLKFPVQRSPFRVEGTKGSGFTVLRSGLKELRVPGLSASGGFTVLRSGLKDEILF